MHLLRRDEFPSVSCNAGAPRADLPTPTPPAGGWAAWYLTDEDDMGEGTEQGINIRLLLAAITELARERGWTRTFVGSDQFFAWVEAEPLVRISPDIYLLEDPPHPYPISWQTWRPGHAPPRFAMEVVSHDYRKDYDDAPAKYDQLGARELVVFDPAPALRSRNPRVLLQVHRRDQDGRWQRVYSGPGPVHSVELDAWLVVVPGPRLRVARDSAGLDLVRTPEELLLERDATIRAQAATIRDLEATIRTHEATIRTQAATIRAQAATIRNLEAKVDSLEAKVATLEALVARLLERPQ